MESQLAIAPFATAQNSREKKLPLLRIDRVAWVGDFRLHRGAVIRTPANANIMFLFVDNFHFDFYIFIKADGKKCCGRNTHIIDESGQTQKKRTRQHDNGRQFMPCVRWLQPYAVPLLLLKRDNLMAHITLITIILCKQ